MSRQGQEPRNTAAYDAKAAWTDFYLKKDRFWKTYPNEYLVRIFMGRYPRLELDKSLYPNQRVCDLGCGDGRNLVLFHNLGLETHGVEITPDIVAATRRRLKEVENVEVDVRAGNNSHIPYPDEYFDYLVSWCACYYMGQERDFGVYVREFSRVLRPNGSFVAAVIKPSHVAKYSVPVRPGYCVLQDEPVGIRNGELFRVFENEEDIKKEFGPYFDRFVVGSQHDDIFGSPFHVWVIVCQKKP